MNIPAQDARARFTKALVANYSDQLKPKDFGRSFFIETESYEKEISIEVQRNNEMVAVDVLRGSDGNRNVFDRSTEKIFVPPFYDEYFDMTSLAAYDKLYVEPEISGINFGRLIQSASAKMEVLMDKINRAYEKQAWQVFMTGIVELEKGTNIDYKRKALSLVDLGSSAYWNASLVDPNTALETAAKFCREVGKADGGVFNVVIGDLAFDAFVNNTAVQNRGKIFAYSFDMLQPQQRDSRGASFHGIVSAGSYTFRIWTYPEVYTDASGAMVQYMDSKSIVVLPMVPKFVLSYAGVPQLLTEGQPPVKGKFMAYDFMDKRKRTHDLGVMSAGVAIPVGVDQIWTGKVLA